MTFKLPQGNLPGFQMPLKKLFQGLSVVPAILLQISQILCSVSYLTTFIQLTQASSQYSSGVYNTIKFILKFISTDWVSWIDH